MLLDLQRIGALAENPPKRLKLTNSALNKHPLCEHFQHPLKHLRHRLQRLYYKSLIHILSYIFMIMTYPNIYCLNFIVFF